MDKSKWLSFQIWNGNHVNIPIFISQALQKWKQRIDIDWSCLDIDGNSLPWGCWFEDGTRWSQHFANLAWPKSVSSKPQKALEKNMHNWLLLSPEWANQGHWSLDSVEYSWKRKRKDTTIHQNQPYTSPFFWFVVVWGKDSWSEVCEHDWIGHLIQSIHHWVSVSLG